MDCNVKRVTVTNNLVHHNSAIGISVETVDGAVGAYNRVWENVWASGGWRWAYGGGIVISSSGGGLTCITTSSLGLLTVSASSRRTAPTRS